MTNDYYHDLALEILKAKFDISNSSEKDILIAYRDICTRLKSSEKDIKRESGKVGLSTLK